MLCIFLSRDDFESLKCWLDLWLSSLLVCIHFCVFLPFLKNCFLSSSTAFRRIFDPSNHYGICVDSLSTDSRSIEKVSIYRLLIHQGIFAVDRFSIAPRQIYLSRISVWQNLDRSSTRQDAFSLNSFSTKIKSHFFYLSPQKPTFWWVFCEIFGLGIVFLMLYAHAFYYICIFTMFHAL